MSRPAAFFACALALSLLLACSSSGDEMGPLEPGPAGGGGAAGGVGPGGGNSGGGQAGAPIGGGGGGGGGGGAGGQGPRLVELNFLFIHGVQGDENGQSKAERSLTDLEASLLPELAARAATFELANPLVRVRVKSARANIYTGQPSAYYPSDSKGPIAIDDWEVGAPGCETTRQGDPCTTAFEWRYRLAREIERLFPNGESNLILVGHSTGARRVRNHGRCRPRRRRHLRLGRARARRGRSVDSRHDRRAQ